VFAALGIQHAMRMLRFVMYGLSGCTTLLHFISQTARLKNEGIEQTLCVLISSKTFVCDIFLTNRNERDMIINAQ
jgi:hypothetical protein